VVNILTVVVMPAPIDAERRLTPLAQVLEVDSGLRAGSEGRRDYTSRPTGCGNPAVAHRFSSNPYLALASPLIEQAEL
jgi:hypothetical protein